MRETPGGADPNGPPVRPNLAFLLPALVVFCLGAATEMDAPGVYMDAVNPDYIIVRLLNPTAVPAAEVWTIPGTLLFGRFPLLGQIYHGALPFYVGLPTYALFGTGVLGIRLTNLVFGCMVLASAGSLMLAFRARPAIAAFCLLLLALDPAFLFSFRTQFYITLLAAAPLLLSVSLTEWRGAGPSGRDALLAGFLAGLSCYGYFIYAFLAPAAAGHALLRWRGIPGAPRRCTLWMAAFALGVLPYLAAALLMLLKLGGQRSAEFMRDYLGVLHVAGHPLSLSQRLVFFGRMVRGTLLDTGPSTIMLGEALPLYAPHLKLAVLLGVPSLGLAAGLLRVRLRAVVPRALAGLATIAGLVVGLLILVLLFGDRLGLHHAVFLVPVLYAALALSLSRLSAFLAPMHRRAAWLAPAILLLPLLATNVPDRLMVLRRLGVTGGVGLASDAITRFAEDSMRNAAPATMFFPDWGVSAPFAMLTQGSIPYVMAFDPGEVHRVLCARRDAVLVTRANMPEARLDRWMEAVAWGAPERRTYDQRDGTPVLIVSRWRAQERPAGACR